MTTPQIVRPKRPRESLTRFITTWATASWPARGWLPDSCRTTLARQVSSASTTCERPVTGASVSGEGTRSRRPPLRIWSASSGAAGCSTTSASAGAGCGRKRKGHGRGSDLDSLGKLMRLGRTGGQRETEGRQSGAGKRDGTHGHRKRLSKKRHSILHNMAPNGERRAQQRVPRGSAFHVLSWDEGYASRDRGVLWRANLDECNNGTASREPNGMNGGPEMTFRLCLNRLPEPSNSLTARQYSSSASG